ncbi:unnamed protein product [Adineta ricciae]|uniref:Uncharacterized protein n=1 Tax=Adineta ricciae TaxID=249248 RepID=A0A814CK73_ADIRI|nr:unnamed protein product [Adineta ricciae]
MGDTNDYLLRNRDGKWTSYSLCLIISCALCALGVIAVVIVLALLPIYLKDKGEDIETTTSKALFEVNYNTPMIVTSTTEVTDLDSLSNEMNTALDVSEIKISFAQLISTSSGKKKRRETKKCENNEKANANVFVIQFYTDFSKTCRTSKCQQNIINKITLHVRTRLTQITISTSLANGTSVTLSLSFCSMIRITGDPVATCYDNIQNQNETGTDCGGICAPERQCTDGSSCAVANDCTGNVCASSICLPANCGNGLKDRNETGVDCGAVCAAGKKCSVYAGCQTALDCTSGVCASGVCLSATCNNNVQDLSETGVDCGGSCALGKKCVDGGQCNVSTDCSSNLCVSQVCLPTQCANGVQDNGETGTDCGGPCATGKKCADGGRCTVNVDCTSNVCSTQLCLSRQCGNGVQDNGETGTDCGGPCAAGKKCADASQCTVSADCSSNLCVSQLCLPSKCANGVQDNGETGTDCGGPCAAGKKCADASQCTVPADCSSNVCATQICLPSQCANGVQDNGETGTDCGGPCAAGKKCADASQCTVPADCSSNVCATQICLPSQCGNGVKDNGETDQDCGGPCAAGQKCADNKLCSAASDCTINACSSGRCALLSPPTLVGKTPGTAQWGASSIAAGDFNNDGKMDFIVSEYHNYRAELFTGDGTGAMTSLSTLDTANHPAYGAAGDFNGDGNLDYVAVSDDYGYLRLFQGSGTGTFTQTYNQNDGKRKSTVIPADYNGDGKLDFAVSYYADNMVYLYIANNANSFNSPGIFAVGSNPRKMASGKFDSDNYADLAVINENDGTISILLGKSDGTFGTATTISVAASINTIAVAKLNGDNYLDLILTVPNTHSLSVLLGDGNGNFGTPNTFLAGGNGPSKIDVADMDLDGILDAVVAFDYSGTQQVGVLLGKGDGTFYQATRFFALTYGPAHITAVKVDGDNRPDVIVTGGDSYTVFLNTGP